VVFCQATIASSIDTPLSDDRCCLSELEAVMSLDANANVLQFPSRHLSPRDRAMIEEWQRAAARRGILDATVRDDTTENGALPVATRIMVRFQRGVADGRFVLIQRAHGTRKWVSLLLRLEPDGTMTLPIESAEPIRQDPSLRDALNGVRCVLPEEPNVLLAYSTAARSIPTRKTATVAGALAKAT
jgi:hypothetical protein